MNILIIDDDPDICDVISSVLSSMGHYVVVAEDGLVGIDMCKKKNPDLVLLDVVMPKIDGIKVCQRLKKHPKTKDIPVIMISTKSHISDINLALMNGADDYIAKPFSSENLNNMIMLKWERIKGGTAVDWCSEEEDVSKKITKLKKEFDTMLKFDYKTGVKQLSNGKWTFKCLNEDFPKENFEVDTKEDALFFALHDYYGWVRSAHVKITDLEKST